jgi:dipeptidyl aminopeptidase/acylaminoacyl peptidase
MKVLHRAPRPPAASPFRQRTLDRSLLAGVAIASVLAGACGNDSPVEQTPEQTGAILVHDLRGYHASTIRPDGGVDRAYVSPGHQPRWLPDGKRVLVWLLPPPKSTTEKAHLWIVTLDGGVQRLVDAAGPLREEMSGFVAPRGDWIYFYGVADTGEGIWRVRSDQSGLELLIPRARGTALLTVRGVSDDNQRLLVEETSDTRVEQLGIYDIQAKALTRLPLFGTGARWSPDQRSIAYIDQSARTVNVAGTDGTAPRAVFHRPPPATPQPFPTDFLRGLTWSPDGQEILVGIQDIGLERIDLRTGKSARVPGSESFVDPDWLRQ